jgi:hypothetical protein
MLYNRMIGELLILLPTYARWRFSFMCDETGRATSAVESNNLVGRGHAWAGRWASLVQTNMQKRKEPATCDASHARFPGEGHTLFSDGDRRLRTLRSAVRSPPRLPVWLGSAHVVRPPLRRPCQCAHSPVGGTEPGPGCAGWRSAR